MTIKLPLTEYEIQRDIAKWLRARMILFTASVAGIKMHPRVMSKLKASGYVDGTPDLLIFEPRGKYCGLFIELKTMTGKPSAEQIEYRDKLRDRAYKAEICKGYDESIDVIENYLSKRI